MTSGSTALKVALASLGVGYGDEVITQGFTFVATWEAILDCGAKPVFCEVDETLCMAPEDLKKKITDKTRCIVPVHMMGAQARITEIMAIAGEAGIPVLEDTAQSAGCTLERQAPGHLRGHGHLQLRFGKDPHLRRGRAWSSPTPLSFTRTPASTRTTAMTTSRWAGATRDAASWA